VEYLKDGRPEKPDAGFAKMFFAENEATANEFSLDHALDASGEEVPIQEVENFNKLLSANTDAAFVRYLMDNIKETYKTSAASGLRY